MSLASQAKEALGAVPSPVWLGLGLGAVALVGVAIVGKLAMNLDAQRAGEWLGRSAGEGAAGTVLGLGDALGIPRTDETECERALREGRTWDASFACPAGKFIREGLLGLGKPRAQPYAGDVYL